MSSRLVYVRIDANAKRAEFSSHARTALNLKMWRCALQLQRRVSSCGGSKTAVWRSPPPIAALRFCSSSRVEPSADLLVRFMRDKIRSSGALTVHEFMSLATSSASGYYATRPKEVSAAASKAIRKSAKFTSLFFCFLVCTHRRRRRFCDVARVESSVRRVARRLDLQ